MEQNEVKRETENKTIQLDIEMKEKSEKRLMEYATACAEHKKE